MHHSKTSAKIHANQSNWRLTRNLKMISLGIFSTKYLINTITCYVNLLNSKCSCCVKVTYRQKMVEFHTKKSSTSYSFWLMTENICYVLNKSILFSWHNNHVVQYHNFWGRFPLNSLWNTSQTIFTFPKSN